MKTKSIKNYVVKVISIFSIITIIYGCSKDSLHKDSINKEVLENVFIPREGVATTTNYLGVEVDVIDDGDYYIFQGDILIDKDGNENKNVQSGTSNRGAGIDGKKWRDNKVYYIVNNDFPRPDQLDIHIAHIESKTNIEFILRTNQPDYIEFKKSPSSFSDSFVGRQGGKQAVRISAVDGGSATIVHEICHALGMFHEQSREDRDNSIIVNFDAIPDNIISHSNFKIFSQNGNGGFDHENFDFNSVMLYGSTIWPGETEYDMTKIDGSPFGEYYALSNGDERLLDQVYKKIVPGSGSTSSTTEFSFADVNGDNKADKIYWKYGSYGGNIRVFLATTGGNFSSSAIESSGSSSNKTKFNFADINGDGKADKIYWKYDKYGGNIRVFLATSGGNFSSSAVQSSGSSSNKTKFYYADVNGDNKADKIYWKYDKYGGDVRVYLATSNGGFSSSAVQSSGSSSNITELSFADINGDGKSDKIYWKYDKYGGDVRVFLATSGGGFSSTAVHSSGSSSLVTKIYFADVNTDGKADKIYWKYDSYGGDTRTFISTTNGDFDDIARQSAGSKLLSTKMYFSDINGGGRADRMYWNTGEYSGDVRVFLADMF